MTLNEFHFFFYFTLGQNTTFYPQITKNLMFENCEFWEKWDFENVNFVTNEILKMWIFWKMRFWKCKFCEKWDFEIVNLVKYETFKMWIFGYVEDFCLSVSSSILWISDILSYWVSSSVSSFSKNLSGGWTETPQQSFQHRGWVLREFHCINSTQIFWPWEYRTGPKSLKVTNGTLFRSFIFLILFVGEYDVCTYSIGAISTH